LKTSALLREIARRFSRAKLHYGHGTHNAKEEAAWLISSQLGYLLEEEVPAAKQKRIEALAARRIKERVPLAYVLKEAWLGEHSFYIDKRAIVPRSFIAEMLRERLQPWVAKEPKTVLDLCTGSGCLAVLVALTFESARVDAADISAPALEVAKRNVARYKLQKRIRLVKSDLFSGLKGRKYDLILCNPPYVTTRSMTKLPTEYRREPKLALGAGDDGLDFVKRLLSEVKSHLDPGGILICEIGGNRKALERAFPKLEVAWPETSDPGSVFVVGRGQLEP
jgi:ribosomal protein L3 glutamine methyltransferase